MPKMHKPTAWEKNIIRDCAKKSAGCKGVKLEPGERVRLGSQRGEPGDRYSLNLALLADDDHLDNTDLFTTRPWRDFVDGFPLTGDGRAVIDFYVYETAYPGDLMTNVMAYWRNNKLMMVKDSGGVLWQAYEE